MTCQKRDFLTRSSAQKFKRRNHRQYGGQASVYKCPYCSTPVQVIYHLTTKPRDVLERLRQREDG